MKIFLKSSIIKGFTHIREECYCVLSLMLFEPEIAHNSADPTILFSKITNSIT